MEVSGKSETQMVMKGGLLVCLLASSVGFFISFFGGVFIVLVMATTFYFSSYFASKQRSVGNLFRGSVPPRTAWVARVEFDHVLVPQDVDMALERLYERVISEHLDSWYRDLSHDEEFLQEMRKIFRDATTELLTRLTRVDLTETLLNDVLPIGLQHLDSYLWAVHHAGLEECLTSEKGDKKLINTWLAFMGKEVQPALTSRASETEFLENLSEKLLPILLKGHHMRSRLASSLATAVLSSTLLQPLLDLLCTPHQLNKLLLLWFSPDPIVHHPSCPDPPVRLLLRFVHGSSQPKPSALHVDLSAILKDTALLYPFLQYLKKNGGVNLLQFCLAVEDFNKKMMVVDLPDEKLQALHKEAKVLYDSYIKVGSDNFIKFDNDIIKEVGGIINQGHKSIQKLRTTPPLFRAYEQVYNNLEDNFCPAFHTSDEYLSLVLGPRLSLAGPTGHVRQLQGTKTTSTPTTMKGKLAKIKTEVLGGGPLDGSPEPECEPAFDLVGIAEDQEEDQGARGEARDLSAWRVTVPRLEARSFDGRSCFTFIIQVQRIDVASRSEGEDLEWSVERQYHEFYSLQSALVQYHGIFEDAKLPPRAKLFGGKGLDVLQSKLEPFEDFLVRLLQKPNLKKSDLLFTFLTSKQEFNEAASQLGLSRMIKTVPQIIKKEKGQFLQTFISTFATSTVSPPPRPGRLEGEEDSLEDSNLESIFGDNFELGGANSLLPATLGPSHTCSVTGLYDSLMYLALRLFKLTEPWLKLISGLRWLVADSLNHLAQFMLASKLDTLLTSGRVTRLIEAVEEAVFDPTPPTEAKGEEEKRREETLAAFRSYLPPLLARFLGNSFEPSTEAVFRCLQVPLLNKQLTYTLLETVLVKVFPELRL